MTRFLNPDTLAAPSGYSNGVSMPVGRILFVAGQVAWDEHRKMVSTDFAAQFEQALKNVLAVVREAGGGPQHIGRMTIYVTDKARYEQQTRQVGEAYRALMGKHYPAMSLVQVAALLEDGGLLEIEATAVLPAEVT